MVRRIVAVVATLLLPLATLAETGKASFGVSGDLQFGTNCIGPDATAYPYAEAAFDWAVTKGIDGAIQLGDLLQQTVDCECRGTANPGVCTDIDHSIWGTGYCTTCGNADAMLCSGGTIGLLCEWTRARALMDKFEVAGIPWLVTPGNHDTDVFTEFGGGGPVAGGTWEQYNSYFGPGRLTSNALKVGSKKVMSANKPGFIGFEVQELGASSYMIVSAGGQRFLFISLHYFIEDELVDWALDVISDNPGMPTVVFSHIIHEGTNAPNGWTENSFNGNGPKFLTSFGSIPQVFLHISGHDQDMMYFEDTSEEYRVLGFLMDYSYDATVTDTTLPNQDEDHGGGGAMGILSIDMIAGQVSYYVYSPEDDTLDQHVTDATFRSIWSEKIPFCGTSGRFKMDLGACTGYKEPTPIGGIGK